VPNFTVYGEGKSEGTKEKPKKTVSLGVVAVICAVSILISATLGALAGAVAGGANVIKFGAGNGKDTVNIIKSDREIEVEEITGSTGHTDLTVAQVAALVGDSVVEITTMNISYGQLYRWKREGLIPDEWFNKQSVSTGQETFFERKLIIPRINKILELKDKYQLDELKEFFDSNFVSRKYNLRDVIILDSIDPFILKQYSQNHEIFSVLELAVLSIFSSNKDLLDYNEYIDMVFPKEIDNYFYIVGNDQKYVIIGPDNLILDSKLTIHKKIKIEDVMSDIASELKN
jgi:hypothetical protein